jgi:lipopolysaccharide/colanic/teichoic acid biosynthesis glycosyltransferase
MKLQKNLHTSLVILIDVVLLLVSLYIALIIRHYTESDPLAVEERFFQHIFYFIPLYAVMISILYISLAYADTTLAYLRRSIPKLAESLTASAVLGVTYFYIFAGFLPISPKLTYAIFFAVSFVLLAISRIAYAKLPLLGAHINALVLMKDGSVYESAISEMRSRAPRATFTRVVELHVDGVLKSLKETGATVLVYDNTDRSIVQLISMLPTHVIRSTPVLSTDLLHEHIFGKIFLPTFSEESLLRDYLNQKPLFEIAKRVFDLCIAIPLFILTLPLVVVAAIAVYLETGRPIFIFQDRLGVGRRVMHIPKMRSMSGNVNGAWVGEGENKVTKVGAVLRKTRIDELPQLWSVITGEMSLIGPRPDMTGLEERLREEIDFYHARYTVPPGVSGWAQVTQTIVPQSIEETRDRFAYDMYYIKNRSFFLDFSIALKTVRILLSRLGR